MHKSLPDVELFPGCAEVPVERASQVKNVWRPEWNRFADPLTGREVIRLTGSRATDQHPYFTGPAVTADGQRLIFISDRTGNPNLFSLDLHTGEILQLTDNRYGVLRQYVSPWGNMRGFGKWAVCLHAGSGNIYFMQGRQVRKVNVYTAAQHIIAELPPGWVTAFTHVSSDDKLLCLPIVQAEAFEDEGESVWASETGGNDGFYSIERRVMQRGLRSLLWVVATDGSMQEIRAEQNAWITHVQFRPNDNRYIVFNNEAIADRPGTQRIWMCGPKDGSGPMTVWKIRPEPADQRFWNCHELWTFDGNEILYHGQQLHPRSGKWQSFYGFSDVSGQKYREFFLRPDDCGDRRYGHFGVHTQHNRAWCDGYFDMSLITEVTVDAEGYAKATPVCRHGTQWLCQDDHPHPILAPDRRLLIYTSSIEGTANVYGVRVEA